MIDSTLKNANILIVDDQEANIAVLTGFLLMQDYTNIGSTIDPRQVADLITIFKPDLILLDLSMPYMSGFEVMKQIKSLIPADLFLPILVLTADISFESKKKALSDGAHDFLTKPFDLVEVGLRIKNLLFTSHLQQQLQNQNLELEEKVKERTSKLENINSELLIAKDKASASDHLKTAFMQNISHEIRTPLNGVIGFGALLTEKDATFEERENYLELLRSSSTRLINTITDYMDISLIVSNNMEVTKSLVDIISILNEIKSTFQVQCNIKHLDLILEIPKGFETFNLEIDIELYKKIFIHFIDNALKYTTTGSIAFGFELLPEKIEFFVNDTGIGIERDMQEKLSNGLANAYVSNSREKVRRGLGLTISQKIIELIGGSFQLQSLKDHGSRFSFTIPYILELDKRNEKTIESSDNSKVKRLQDLKILVAEDDEISAMYYKEILRKSCREILHVKTGEDAVIACKQNPDIDCILMDIRMPVMNGNEAIKKIRAFNSNVIIIVQTAYGQRGDREKALLSGSDDYISKPFSAVGLIELIEKHLNL